MRREVLGAQDRDATQVLLNFILVIEGIGSGSEGFSGKNLAKIRILLNLLNILFLDINIKIILF